MEADFDADSATALDDMDFECEVDCDGVGRDDAEIEELCDEEGVLIGDFD